MADVTNPQRARRYHLKITPADVRNPGSHLVCYAATLAKNAIAQNSCGSADPKDKRTNIVPTSPTSSR